MKDSLLMRIFKYAVLTSLAVIFLFPFVWMIIGATNTSTDIIQGKVSFGANFIENFNNLFGKTEIVRALLNTTYLAIMTTILSLIVTSVAAYGFHVYKSNVSEKVYNILLLSMMVPFAALMIPLFRISADVGILDTFLVVILQGATSVFLVFFFRQNFKSFPTEIIEAARIDGTKEFMIFLKIVVPSMKATYAAAAIFAFLGSWNNYLWPLIALQSPENQTLTLFISSLSTSYSPDFGILMIAIIVATLPVLIVFFMLQKYFVEGMVGSGK